MDRRGFLIGAAALAAAPRLPRAGAATLRAAPAQHSLVGSAYPATEVWAYNGAVPGPVLRYRQGERLRIEVENALAVGTTVHWHGVRVPNAMDGVPHVTQAPIAPRGGRFVYEFELPDAGTFWYHPHLGSAEQVARGLAGALVVEEREAPAVDRDVLWFLSDWRLDREARIVPDFASVMDASHAGRIGNTVTLNGAIPEFFDVRAGERIRLRLVNASNARIYALSFDAHRPSIIALDGHGVEPHGAERVVLGPGMRVDLVLDCGAQPGSVHRVVDDFYRQRAYELLRLRYDDRPPLRSRFPALPRLPANALPEPDLARAQRHEIVFGGGAMGRVPDQALHQGAFWSVNGRPAPAGHEHRHEPLLRLRRGSAHVLELVNDTAWHHPIHLHGHVFRVLATGHWADTVLLAPKGRAQIAFVADNPGDWMLHCHVLEHQASGMTAMLRVE